MMRNPEQTVGNLMDKQGNAFIASVDGEGFPNLKANPKAAIYFKPIKAKGKL